MILSSVSSAVKSWVDMDGDLVVRAVGIPFTSPFKDNRDLTAEYFTPNTDLGVLTQVPLYFHHAELAEQYPQLAHFFRQPLGRAIKAEVTDEGVIFDIIIEKHHKYVNMLRRLIEMGVLQVSSGAYPFTVVKGNDGEILSWHIAELSLTPSAANPDARIIAAKSILEGVMEENLEPVASAEAGMEEETSVTLPEMMLYIKSALDTLAARVDAYAEENRALRSEMEQLRNGMQEMARSMNEALRVRLERMDNLSSTEKAVLAEAVRAKRAANYASAFPDNAPGRERRAHFSSNYDEGSRS